MGSSEGWTTDTFEQSSDDLRSTSTGRITNPTDLESDMLRAGVEVVSSAAQKKVGASIPEREARESIVAFAEGRLEGISRQDHIQGFFSAPVQVSLTGVAYR
jgi:hypothetical protein